LQTSTGYNVPQQTRDGDRWQHNRSELNSSINPSRQHTGSRAAASLFPLEERDRTFKSPFLGNDFQSGTTLDLVASALRFDHNAPLRGVSRAAPTMDEEARAATHVVGGSGIQVVAILHSFEVTHVAESVGSLGQWTHTHLALAAGVIAAAP
jgi:hypothetical protein